MQYDWIEKYTWHKFFFRHQVTFDDDTSSPVYIGASHMCYFAPSGFKGIQGSRGWHSVDPEGGGWSDRVTEMSEGVAVFLIRPQLIMPRLHKSQAKPHKRWGQLCVACGRPNGKIHKTLFKAVTRLKTNAHISLRCTSPYIPLCQRVKEWQRV